MKIALSALLAALAAQLASGDGPELTVRTLTGAFTGLVNERYPNVREFRNIPYAQPPVGKRRWLPPVALPPSGQQFFSYRWPPSCSQYLYKAPSLWNSNITGFYIGTAGQPLTAGEQAQTSSEDCLSLAVWTPLNASADSRLPVAVFLPGGDFQTGGVDIQYQMPAPLVSRRDLVVVTLNYRLNIFGYPNAAALDDQNLGILDQRMALEWLRANVAAFGGDPERMVLWGQSAGAVAADIHNYAFYEEPLVKGFYLMSGTAAVAGNKVDPTFSNFTFVARGLGCDFAGDARAEIECMRQVPGALIVNFLGHYLEGRNASQPRLGFYPVPDERIYFANYSDRAARGLMARLPALVSTCANEEAALYPYPAHNLTAGPWQPAVDRATLDVFVCPASNTTEWRAALGLPTYRYQYAGNFSSVTPLWWMGAYHASDVPMVFGTYAERPEPPTALQGTAAEAMQDYVYAFVADPEDGLRRLGWPPQEAPVAEGGFMMRFAAGDDAQQDISSVEVDGACIGRGAYDHSPL